MNKKGIVLVAAVILIIFAAVVTFSITTFIIQRLSQEQDNQARAKYIYLAKAGIHNAIYFFRLHDIAGNGYFSLGQTNIDANNFFVLSATAADLLMLNTSHSSVGNQGNRDLLGLTIQNATNTKAITIDRMIVTWNNNRKLKQIRINNSDVFNGNLKSPANVNITNFTLNKLPKIYNIEYIRFNNDMRGVKISVQFVMSDGSITRNFGVFPASSTYSFTIKSTSKIVNSDIYRTIQADYNTLTGRITDCREINTQITP